MDDSTRSGRRLSWILQLVAAAILGQTLYFKFTAAPESVAIFRALGVEPWGRLATGALELATILLLVLPHMALLGGLFGLGLMAGAIGAHLFRLGIEVEGDGGLLFGLACTVLLASAGIVWLRRRPLLALLRPSRA